MFYCFYEKIKCMYVCNVTSLVHSYIVITVFFLGLVSGLLSGLFQGTMLPFSHFPFMFQFVLVFFNFLLQS